MRDHVGTTSERNKEEPKEKGASNDRPTKQAHEKEKERLRYLEHRVRDLKEFERRASGK